MKQLLPLAALCLLGCAAGCREHSADPKLTWSVENLAVDSGPAMYRQSFVLTGDLRGVDRLAFNQFARRMELADSLDTLIEIVPGYYAIGSPRFASATGNDTIRFDILTRGIFRSICYAPDGAHLVLSDGSTRGLATEYQDLLADPSGYSAAGADLMPYGDTFYALNETLAAGEAGPYDAVPSFKDVRYLGGDTTVDPDKAEYREGGDSATEAYTITVADGKMTVEAPRAMWPRLRRRVAATFGHGSRTLPQAVINDRPSLPYRGVMIDIARNFQTAAELHKVIDLMADYGLNTLHFHPVDDEAWRLEIEALPELTAVGSRRGYTPGSDGSFLPQIFAGDGNPDTKGNTANGYISRAEMISLLQHADSLGIRVLPEIESPGHARAAIEAMKYRARTTGDDSFLLAESADVDTSRYTSAQNFHDNVMNPALEGPYRFMDVVADAIIDMYKEAGVELPAIHIGGDEVPRGAWSGSPAVKAFMEEKGLTSEKEVHSYYVQRVADMYARKGVKISGWQEVALRHSPEFNEAVCPQMFSVNCWSTLPSHGQAGVVRDIAEAGYPVVLSNVDHFYLDMTYSYHPYERGLSWGGTTDEFSALNGYPYVLCPVEGANIQGVQGQVFAETIRSAAGLEHMLLPKILGLAERGWNPDTTYTDAAFNAVVARHIPRWEQAGYAYHLRQPGITLLDDNTLGFNSPYADAEIHYTLDGSNPTAQSPVVGADGKVDISGMTPRPTQARAILVTPTEQSVVTVYNLH
ncbi:MAG: family 20 glycosylhydrolase [Muribaculaceae bacterium]|nr:family 20 glycosylhydrolase [Muribaculaceae bacterium]